MQIENFTQELIQLRRHFHQYPELALQEYETSAYRRRYLGKLGYTITEVPPTGLIAELPGLQNRAKMVVVRAEMDALPITEKTGLPYAADNGCMHACGHDCIIASALILAKIVAKEQEDFPVRVRFLFEPAEEIGKEPDGCCRQVLWRSPGRMPLSCFIMPPICLLEWQSTGDRLLL